MSPHQAAPKAVLIQLWFGKIPDYFKYHLITTRDLEGFDFLIITDDSSLAVEAGNYTVIHKTLDEIGELFYLKTGERMTIPNSKKICDFKIALGDLFSEYCFGYEYVGFYDIDTLFSKMDRVKESMQEGYDFITLADINYADRLNGPFTIMRNCQEFTELYKREDFFRELRSPEITGPDEKSWSDLVCQEYRVKKIYDCRNINQMLGGKNEYHCVWKDGRIWAMDRELEQYHFYHKDQTKFTQLGENTILAAYDKVLISDFYWVTGFTENYQEVGEGLLRSIIKYSNRRCLVYSINFDWTLPPDLLASEQIMVKRFDLTKNGLNNNDKTSFMNAKPLYLIDALDFLPGAKFVYVDADAAITASGDLIKDNFLNLPNYPLINSHTHDDILISVNGEWVNSLSILLNKIGEERTVYPRRKCNAMVFDENSRWFFEEQLELYEKYAGSEPSIFAIYDEDSANALLSKYGFQRGLPVVDIEEVRDLDLSKYSAYSYSVSGNSERAIIPTHVNEVFLFHQLKNKRDFDEIRDNYDKTVIAQDEIVVKYENNSFVWQRNVYDVKGRLPEQIDFIIYDEAGKEIFNLQNQFFRQYWTFCVWDLPLSPGLYQTRAVDSITKRILYSNAIVINK